MSQTAPRRPQDADDTRPGNNDVALPDTLRRVRLHKAEWEAHIKARPKYASRNPERHPESVLQRFLQSLATESASMGPEPQGDESEAIVKVTDGMLDQLRWWAEACRTQRAKS